MAKKKKKAPSKSKNIKQAQKLKKRNEKLKKQKSAVQSNSSITIEDQCDAILDLIEDGDLKTARSKLKKLNSKQIKHSLLCYTNGTLAAQEGEYETAVEYFEAAIILDPLFIAAHFNLATAYKSLYEIGKMLTSFLKVVEIGAEDDMVVIKATELLDSFQETLDETDGISISKYIEGEKLFTEAFYLLENGKPTEALVLFNQNLEITPDHAQTYGNIGICYVKLGDKDKALESFEKALEIDPSYELARVNKEIIVRNGIEDSQKENLESINYYVDYGNNDKSYIEDVRNSSDKTL